MNLFSKQVLVAILPLLLAGSSITALTSFLHEKQVLESSRSRALTELSLRARLLEDFFEHRLSEAKTIASAPIVRSGNRVPILEYFRREEIRLSDSIEGLYFNDVEGTVYGTDGTIFSVRDRYYFDDIEQGRVVVSRPIVSRATGNPIVLVLVPIWQEPDKRIGAVGAAIPIQRLLDEIETIRPGKVGFALVVDDEGEILATGIPDEHRDEFAALPGFRPFATGQMDLDIAGQRFQANYTYIPSSRWTLLLAFSRDEILRGVMTIRRTCVLVFCCALFLSFVACIAATRRILHPISDLVAIQQKFGQGDTSVRASLLPRDEVGDLGRSFNRMADRLAERDQLVSQANLQLLQQQQLLQGIVDNSATAISVKRRDGKYLLVNSVYKELLGLENVDFIGKTDDELLSAEEAAARRQDEVILFELNAPLRREETREIDGKSRDFLTVRFPLRDATGKAEAIGTITTEISELKETEHQLREFQQRFERAVRGTNDGIWDWDIEQGSVYYSTRFEELLGYSEGELSPTIETLHCLLHPDDKEEIWAGVQEYLQRGGFYNQELRLKTKDSGYRWFRSRGQVEDEKPGVPRRMAGSITDIHEQKRLESELRQSQKMEAIGQLAGGIAHDFNNLLTVINGYGDILIDDDSLTDENRELVEEMAEAGRRAAQLTKQLLAFGRKQLLMSEWLDLNEVVAQSIRLLQRIIGEHIQLDVEKDHDLWSIFADPHQLEQVILNLAVNARDAMEGGGKLTLSTCNVHLDEATVELKPGPYVTLQVTDTGSGICPHDLERIFEPFFTTKDVGKGTGLGLATVYGIVHQCNGQIFVESTVGQGTTFTIYFPAQTKVDLALEVEDSASNELPSGTETLLLVEDEPAVRDFAKVVLQRSGYEVLVAEGGEDALRTVSSTRANVHLLVTDVIMPEMSGPELAEELTKLQPQMRVLYLSGYPQNEIGADSLVDHKAEYLQKPYSANDLAQMVRSLLDR